MSEPNEAPEIVFGLVGAVGTDLDLMARCLKEALSDFSYQCVQVKLSKLMHDVAAEPWKGLLDAPSYDRYYTHMEAGNEFRGLLGRGDAVAMLAIGAIREIRQEKNGDVNRPVDRHAYLLKSLKHPS
jgi:cytidine deaminase